MKFRTFSRKPVLPLLFALTGPAARKASPEKTSPEETDPAAKASFWVALRVSVFFILLCGIAYPLASTGLAQMLMPANADGSLIRDDSGQVIGSELIGQSFTNPAYFHGRVSSIGYKAEASGSNNYAPSNPDLLGRTKETLNQWVKDNPGVPIREVPIDLVTNSGSGLDPHISPASAVAQIPRIIKLTGLTEVELDDLVKKHTEGRDLGVFGEPRVNVLELNLDLQKTVLTKGQ